MAALPKPRPTVGKAAAPAPPSRPPPSAQYPPDPSMSRRKLDIEPMPEPQATAGAAPQPATAPAKAVSQPAQPVEPEQPQSILIAVPRDPITGGILDTLSWDQILDKYGSDKESSWTPYPGRYYFSGTMSCFLKRWMEVKGVPVTNPENNFDTGAAEAGNATEQHMIYLLQRTYGDRGTILKDIRFSRPLDIEQCAVCNNYPETHVSQNDESVGRSIIDHEYVPGKIALIGRTDPLVIGDNMEVLEFNEIKSKLFWPRALSDLVARCGKEIPLAVAGIEEPENTDGVCNINNLVQLAIGVKFLMDKGMEPRKKKLVYIWRSSFRDHVSIFLTAAEVEALYSLAVWWVTEHHAQLQSDEPPAPRFFMGYECRRCPVNAACADRLKVTGQKREIHPVMRGINRRILDANRSGAVA